MGIEVNGVIGLLILIADIWAIVNIMSASVSVGSKVLWILIVLLLPVVGLLIWLFAGPRAT
ncbi:PLDc N-terminal domain-containing protein [Congregibacter brevis]|uniref:PLDc N-terminal domain-containing protein n=1 Tax=Congregibacter brevis TaxID=3081201 RepID=A0ABZ0IAV2_9GAMM|nr:PLDc N-terminal domain-containing protein [Congregibacter sp. IMCC45268]